MARHIPRIYIDTLANDTFEISCNQFNHLFSVFRLSINQNFIAFNKTDGEWLCTVYEIYKKTAFAKKLKLLRSYEKSYELHLAFCIVKNTNIKLIIEKGTELGVSQFFPLNSQYVNNHNIEIDKLTAIATTAAEQSERLDIPVINPIVEIVSFLHNLPGDVEWYSCLEREYSNVNYDMKNKSCGFIIGPEGGFSETEKDLLKSKTKQLSLSKRILRSETAVVSCLSIYNFENR
ncbi:MAG: 16S rRNA (uracil(1498)-N(3))-methyltransferase [Holosporales bacterium]|nr:16S rRNA (uracil(1498)-N(3))-methyltransferase [Holosporales bacterium]